MKTYDQVTGLCPESPGYSFGTVQMLLDWAVLLKRAGIDILFSAIDMQAHNPSKRVSFCGSLGLIREKEGKIQLMYLGCGRSLKKGNFVLDSDRDVYAAIYMQHGTWYYSATGPIRLKMGKETKKLNEGYHQKI